MASPSDSETLLGVVGSLFVKHGDLAGLDSRHWTKENIRLEEVGNGNLNTVHKISLKDDSQAVITKHAPPYIKILGPGYPLPTDRLRIEYKALSRFNSLAEGSVPKLYFFDEEKNIMCMEYLDGFSDLRTAIINGKFHLDVARQLGTFMAAIHGGTHRSKLTHDELQQLDQEFQNTGLVDLTAQFVFTRPFTADDVTNVNPDVIKPHLSLVYDDPVVLAAAEEMKSLFLEKKECLVHGDLHTGSVMVNKSQTKVIDAEFAYVGPAAFDVGSLVANYLMAYFCHVSIAGNHDVHRAFALTMVDACRLTVNTYFERLGVYSSHTKPQHEKAFMTEVAGFAGCEILRRIIGAGQIADFQAPGVSQMAMEDAFQAGLRLLTAYKQIHSIDKLTVIALMLA